VRKGPCALGPPRNVTPAVSPDHQRNTITCDRYGCGTQDSFEGELSPEEALIRFHVLGWRFTEHDGREFHHCPIHF
jgi:hypothetical protein